MERSLSPDEAEASVLDHDDGVGESSVRRHVRHITSLQVHNLTPFPARDTLASTLSQRPPVTVHGFSSDDSDIALGRRRGRKVSSASAKTIRILFADQAHEHGADAADGPQAPNIRRRTSSKASSHCATPTSGSPSARRQAHSLSAGTTPTVRRNRPRTSSHSSMLDRSSFLSDHPDLHAQTMPASTFPYTQRNLEKVIWSRLVETFITISLPIEDSAPSPQPEPSPTAARPSPETPSSSARRTPLNASASRRQGIATSASAQSRLSANDSRSPTSSSKAKRAGSSSSPSSASRARHTPSDSVPAVTTVSSDSPRKITFPHSPPPTPPPQVLPDGPPAPIYISPFHAPSTNPRFALNARERDFSECAELGAERVRLCLWGRSNVEWRAANGDVKGKGKEIDVDWKLLRVWNVDLNELVRLPDDLLGQPWKLPPNTLLVRFAPSGRAHCLPNVISSDSPSPSRAHSPDYMSDPEATTRTRKSVDLDLDTRRSEEAATRRRSRRSKGDIRSAGYQDLIKLLSLQSVLADTKASLQEVISGCDELIRSNKIGTLRREASEREYHLQVLRERKDTVEDIVRAVRSDMAERRRQLNQRRAVLAEARTLYEDSVLSEFDLGARVAEEKKKHSALSSDIQITRTALLTTLAYIFPIELVSPPDLLFTILGVPLPIPLGASEPAPPLALPGQPDVNEDGAASALGYAALVVQLLGAYLGDRLVYPITYVGSRSLIKDPISAMTGPRMFPLYSKGVDTYRFEYAVFLLNKDIEMLMADRNLRALDTRHTLPNLKNLLLTLTNGDVPPSDRAMPSPSISSGLQSPARVVSPPPTIVTTEASPGSTPKVKATDLPTTPTEANPGGTSSSNSRVPTLTLTSASSFSLRPKGFGFAPLTLMFRRSPSSGGAKSNASASTSAPAHTTGTAAPDAPDTSDVLEGSSNVEGASHAGASSASRGGGIGGVPANSLAGSDGAGLGHTEEDEDDRRTIRGVATTGADAPLSVNLDLDTDMEADELGPKAKEDEALISVLVLAKAKAGNKNGNAHCDCVNGSEEKGRMRTECLGGDGETASTGVPVETTTSAPHVR